MASKIRNKFRKYKEEKIKEKKELKKKKKIKRRIYRKQKCAFIYTSGKRCTRNAIGSGVFCRKHGGVVTSDSLIPTERTEDYLAYAIKSKFKPDYHPVKYIDLSREGLSDVEIAAKFEVSLKTIKAWSETFEMFNTAFEIGKALHESWWLQQGKDALNDRNFNTSLFKFLTSNKLGYSEKTEAKNLSMNVHGVLVVPAKVSQDEWAEKAQKTIKATNSPDSTNPPDSDTIDATYEEVDKK